MAAEQHDFVLESGSVPGNLGDHVVAVAVGVEVARADLDPQLDRQAGREHAGQHVVVLRGQDDRRLRGRARIPSEHEHRAVLAGVRANQHAGAGAAEDLRDAPLIGLRAAATAASAGRRCGPARRWSPADRDPRARIRSAAAG